MNEQEQFEDWVRGRYRCTDYSFERMADNRYYNAVSRVGSHGDSEDYAGVQMLWEAWRAGKTYQLDLIKNKRNPGYTDIVSNGGMDLRL